ncbi:MAG TPA: heavy metal-binding domain-containing protein [Methanothermobacter sp.]|nr:heavy metal-binding domain-containing protein [Methanothermobacter sp.]HOL69091.1 heavy metal-binding domain-containing protein [Methanothermobacter sp.]HPQ04773.1 heavy metal-binding domain-containing protein [Methanothermobacter sp.]HPU37698.1 heavy metal-binding domain-containing protein [Methanothermobacter sp.]
MVSGDFIVVTSNYIPGYDVVKTIGLVYGLTVRSRGLGGQITANLRSIGGGEIKEYVTMMEHARQEAIDRMISHARELGANAVISTRFDSDSISNIMQELLAYGTAVIAEKKE